MKSIALLALLALPLAAQDPAIETKAVEYKHGDVVLEGWLARPVASGEKRPGVAVVHEWRGHGPYARKRAEMLARMGYTAFAVDMYGKGVFAKDHEEAGKLAGVFFKDRELMRTRLAAGIDVLKAQPDVDATRLAAIGYCFGGTSVLEQARAGADLKGVVSFHGNLSAPRPAEAGKVKAKVLVCHGADDSFVPAEQVAAFQAEMKAAGADLTFVAFGGAVHSFTVPEAGNDPSKGMAYHEKADKRSWEMTRDFLAECFAK